MCGKGKVHIAEKRCDEADMEEAALARCRSGGGYKEATCGKALKLKIVKLCWGGIGKETQRSRINGTRRRYIFKYNKTRGITREIIGKAQLSSGKHSPPSRC
jgi:hypothetical protein